MIIKKEKKKLFFKILVFLIFFAFLFLFSNNLKNTFFIISSPLQKFFYQKGSFFYETKEALFGLQSLKEEIKSLRLKNRELSAKVVVYRDILLENEALRKALEIELKKENDIIFSEVVGSSFDSGSLIVKHGLKEGVEEGDPVVTPEGSLVGSVVEVYNDFSKVRLITSKETSFEVKVQGEEEYIGILHGGDDILIDTLPRDSKIKEGDFVTTYQQEGSYPRSIVIGEVYEIIERDVEAFIQVKAKPLFQLQELDFLFILKE